MAKKHNSKNTDDSQKHQHYIVDKETQEIEHGPFPSEESAKSASQNFSWFDNDKHEIAYGSPDMQDVDDTETEHPLVTDTVPDDESSTLPPPAPQDVDSPPPRDPGLPAAQADDAISGFFIKAEDVADPVAGPFETEDAANESISKFKSLKKNKTTVVKGTISPSGEFTEEVAEQPSEEI